MTQQPPASAQAESARRSIVGVALLRDEERVAAWSLGNVAPFCDRLLVLDNGSTDRTREIVEALARRHAHVEIHDVPDAYDTHRFVEPLAGRPVWVLGVDGDEIYDPAGLARLRALLLAGAFDAHWSLVGHTLHLSGGDLAAGRGQGFVSPPARSITKLYNFAAIESWRQGRHERLHGKNKVFRTSWSAQSVHRLDLAEAWESSAFRCLHLCFLPRSGREPEGARANPVEARSRAKPFKGVERFVRRLIGLPERRPNYKRAHYAQGRRVERDVAAFGRPTDHRAIDPRAAEAEAALQAALRGPAQAAAGLRAATMEEATRA